MTDSPEDERMTTPTVKEDWQTIKDALDTAADALLPDHVYGPMFGKADDAVRRLQRFYATFLKAS